jgi:hypothetical protein
LPEKELKRRREDKSSCILIFVRDGSFLSAQRSGRFIPDKVPQYGLVKWLDWMRNRISLSTSETFSIHLQWFQTVAKKNSYRNA